MRFRLSARIVLALACAGFMPWASACDKMPLLAPTGTVITIFPAATTVPLNGEIEIVATVIENGTTASPPATGTPSNGGTTTPTTGTSNTGAGTPVQNGTLVSFTTTIGRIEPREARTQNGEVRVRFLAGGQSGIAVITAYSGGASGKTPDLKVGTAAVERVLVTANPQTLGPTGGTAEVSARVEDTTGAGLAGVPVSFVADAGQLNPATAITDQNGIARTTLTTSQKAKVTANVAGKTADVTVGLNPRTGISITGPATALPAGTPASFTVSVADTANIRDVLVNFGDGDFQSLGALTKPQTIPHTYTAAGTYTVTATATDASGFTEPVHTAVTVLPAQPPNVLVTASPDPATVNQTVILRAQVSGNTSTVISYEWNFGAGANPPSFKGSSSQVPVSWSTTGSKFITVRVVQANGVTGDGFGTVTITQ
jgi:Big-like domain-containing protein/PKD domain-containing protein